MKTRNRTDKAIHQFFSLKHSEGRKLRALQYTSEPHHTSLLRFSDLLDKNVDELNDENFDFLFKFAEYHLAVAKREQSEAKMQDMLAADLYDNPHKFPIKENRLNDRLETARQYHENATAKRHQAARWLSDVYAKANKRKVKVLDVKGVANANENKE